MNADREECSGQLLIDLRFVMQILVNGESREVGNEMTVSLLLTALGLNRAACAVEVNAALIPKSKHGEHQLKEGDRVELVTLVGGG